MAKIVIDKLVPDGAAWNFQYETELTLVSNTGRMLKYEDESGDTIIFRGRNFQFEGLKVVGGTITQMVAKNSEDYPYVTITELDLKASTFLNVDHPNSGSIRNATNAGKDNILGSIQDDIIFAGRGNDRLAGGAGNDRLWGETGNDIFTGGKGADRFYFAYEVNFGKDTVTDFNVTNEVLILPSDDFVKIKDGADTILQFGQSGQIRVEDVRPSQLTEANYEIFA